MAKLKLGTPRNARRTAIIAIILILVITVLEFPPPIGFETRPQDDVSMGWLWLFLTILISELAAIPLLFKFPRVGAILGLIAGSLNILQVLADQFHLMQPEIAPLYYLLMEDAVALFSLVLIYSSFGIWRKYSK
jgi:hypothetical protein